MYSASGLIFHLSPLCIPEWVQDTANNIMSLPALQDEIYQLHKLTNGANNYYYYIFKHKVH